MMDCKKVLEETNAYDLDTAIKSLREKGLSKGRRKSRRSTKEGRVITYINNATAVILELGVKLILLLAMTTLFS